MFESELRPSEGELEVAVGLLDPEPSREEREFVAALDAADTARLNAGPAPADPWAAVTALSEQARTAELLSRQAQALMLRRVHALTEQVLAEDRCVAAGGTRPAGEEFAADQVAAALGLSRRAAQNRIDDAYALVEGCPLALTCLQVGVLSYPAARVLAAHAGPADQPALRVRVCAQVLDRLTAHLSSPLQGLGGQRSDQIERLAVLADECCRELAGLATPTRIRRLCRQVLADLDVEASRPDPAPSSADVRAYPSRPGWMLLDVELTEADGCQILAGLDADARLLKARPGESRPLGVLRVQALRDRLLGAFPASDPTGAVLPAPTRVDVHLTVDAAGRAATPRFGLLTTGTLQLILGAARATGGDVHIRWVSPQTCPSPHPDPAVLGAHPDPRHPSAALVAAVRMRDKTCRFPGCTVPAARCDLDHSLPWPHGPTCECNVCCLCRHHHRLKTHSRWKVINHGNGHLTWTTPTGHIIRTSPEP